MGWDAVEYRSRTPISLGDSRPHHIPQAGRGPPMPWGRWGRAGDPHAYIGRSVSQSDPNGRTVGRTIDRNSAFNLLNSAIDCGVRRYVGSMAAWSRLR